MSLIASTKNQNIFQLRRRGQIKNLGVEIEAGQDYFEN